MGFRISWMATRASKDEILSALGATPTGATSGWTDYELAVADLLNGWHLVWSEDEMFFESSKRCQKLSKSFPLLACCLSETVMVSSIAEYRDGQKVWSVSHDAQEALDHIAALGEPPAEYRPVLEEAMQDHTAETEEVDHFFEVPTELGYRLCGFKHDEFEEDAVKFHELSIAQKGLFSRLFGR